MHARCLIMEITALELSLAQALHVSLLWRYSKIHLAMTIRPLT